MQQGTFIAAVSSILLVHLSACSQAKSDAAEPAPVVTMMDMDIFGMEAGQAFYMAKREERDIRIPFVLDLKRVAPELYRDSDRIVETPDGSVVMLDVYGSRASPTDERCANGRETFVRVFSLEQRKELFSRLVASCLSRIEAARPVATSPSPDTFRIEGAQPTTYRVALGRVSPFP